LVLVYTPPDFYPWRVFYFHFFLADNTLVGKKDPDIVQKTTKLKDELKQAQIHLIDVPVDFTNKMTEEELTNYCNSPKVNKKYRPKTK
jgi:hypothetical protein